MNEEITGRIKALKQRASNYSILIGEEWYSQLGQSPFNKGDRVEIIFEKKGKFNNILSANLVEKKEDTVDINDSLISIFISYAKDCYCAGKIKRKEISALTREFIKIYQELKKV